MGNPESPEKKASKPKSKPTKALTPVAKAKAPVAKTASALKGAAKAALKSAPAAKKASPAPLAPPPSPSFEEIALRAYFIGEKRAQLELPGDSEHDWVEAERQIIEEAKSQKPLRK